MDRLEIIDEFKELMNEDGHYKKLNNSGIYYIQVKDRILYIGKSKDMFIRAANHMGNVFDEDMPDCNSRKYELLRGLDEAGYDIGIGVACLCNENELGEREGKYIRKYMPILNYQIPNKDNYHKYTVNKTVKEITLEELIAYVNNEWENFQDIFR